MPAIECSLSKFNRATSNAVIAFRCVATYPDATTDERTISGPSAVNELLAWTCFRAAKGAKIKVTKVLKGAKRGT